MSHLIDKPSSPGEEFGVELLDKDDHPIPYDSVLEKIINEVSTEIKSKRKTENGNQQ